MSLHIELLGTKMTKIDCLYISDVDKTDDTLSIICPYDLWIGEDEIELIISDLQKKLKEIKGK